MINPRLYLTLDNCFAIKRWIRPSQWIPLAKELGFFNIEASTDNEFDMLFSTPDYQRDWITEVLEQEQKHGVKVRSFYTGYQTYRTAGLAHPDPRIRREIIEGWFKPLIKNAQIISADVGFCFHAIQEECLQDPLKYREAQELVLRELMELAAFAAEHGVRLCVEQMYVPSQTPWTIGGTKDFLKSIYTGGRPVYTTVDLGHMVGQRKYTRPDRNRVLSALEKLRKGEPLRGQWFGPLSAYEKLRVQSDKPSTGDEAFTAELLEFIGTFDYLFAPLEDSDIYLWLKELGAYSPIMHLQQTDGIGSSHAPFTAENNARGIINGKAFFQTLAESYRCAPEPGMPPKTETITLALEIFLPNVQYSYDGLEGLRETAKYWRQFVPRDGMTLEEVLAGL